MIWYVMLGSAIGGGARYLLGPWVQHRSGAVFPVGTLAINVLGSLVMTFIFRYAMESAAVRPEVRIMLTTGLCGGFTTFSTFSYETLKLIEDGDWHRAAWYVVLSVTMSLAGAFAGLALARQLLELRRHI
jgi:CrcB protein